LEERRVACMVVMGKLEGTKHLGNLLVNGNIILTRKLKET
jgi:hypothetical protein